MATLKVYGAALEHIMDADIDWTADTIKVALLADTYTFDQDAHSFFDDVDQDEVSGAGYTAGGVTLTNPTRTYDSGTNTQTLDADDVEWPNSTITAQYAVIYKSRGGAASADELIACVDAEGNQSSSNSLWAVRWNADGIITLDTP